MGVKSRRQTRRVIGRGTRLALAGAGAVAVALSACVDTDADARAIWLERGQGVDGARTLRVYDSGLLRARTVRFASGGELAASLVLAVDPRGRGAALRSPSPTLGEATPALLTSYIDLEGGRTLSVRVPGDASLGFTGRGDALWWTNPCAPEVSILPLASSFEHALEEGEVQPLRLASASAEGASEGCSERVGVLSAADAPIVFTVPLVAAASAPLLDASGVVGAYGLPDLEGERAAIEELGRGAAAPPGLGAPAWATVLRCDGPPAHCRLGLVDPDGEGLSVPLDDPECALTRWSWRAEGGGGEPSPARCVIEKSVLGDIFVMTPLAAISPEHYVLEAPDGDSLVLLNWRRGERVVAPLQPASLSYRFKPTQDGRVVVGVAPSGPMLRVGVEDVEYLNVEDEDCANAQDPVIAPSGRWAAWACVSYLFTFNGAIATGTVVRVSGDGMERFDGVPMHVSAIDDDGTILMWSRPADGYVDEEGQPVITPRNLYTLTPERVLQRVDSLEPEPALTLDIDGQTPRWFAARAL